MKTIIEKNQSNQNRTRYKVNDILNHVFYILPNFLFEDPKYKALSITDKVIFALLRDRHDLSVSNNKVDKSGNTYIIFTQQEIEELTKTCRKTVYNTLLRLEKHGLIKKEKSPYGLPSKILVKNIPVDDFYCMPKFLFIDDFINLSNNSKVLYSILRDLLPLSIKNNWINEAGEVYIECSRKKMQEISGISKNKITESMAELEEFNLIDDVFIGKGIKNRIYLKMIDFDKEHKYQIGHFKTPLKYENFYSNSEDRELDDITDESFTYEENTENKDVPVFTHEESDENKGIPVFTHGHPSFYSWASQFLLIGIPVFTHTVSQFLPSNYININYTNFNDINHSQSQGHSHIEKGLELDSDATAKQNRTEIPKKAFQDKAKEKSETNDYSHILEKQIQEQQKLIMELKLQISELGENDANVDDLQKYEFYKDLIKENLNYDWILKNYGSIERPNKTINSIDDYASYVKRRDFTALLDTFIEIMAETMASSRKEIKINQVSVGKSLVSKKFEMLTQEQMFFAIKQYQEYAKRTEIKYPKSYILTCLYNATTEQVAREFTC